MQYDFMCAACYERGFTAIGRVGSAAMAKRSVISDVDLLKGAEAIAADTQGPGGRRLKLARVIVGHLDWFEQARRRGLEWADIVALLFRAGATRSDGRPLSRGHLQSLVWRKQQEANASAPAPIIETRKGLVPATVAKRSKRTNLLGGIGVPVADDTGKTYAPPKKGYPRSAGARAADVAHLPVTDPFSSADLHRTKHDDLLAAMRRAARLRRND